MSHGNVSPLYRPTGPMIVMRAAEHFGQVAINIDTLMRGCHTETLLFVSLCHHVKETLEGRGYDLPFSAIRRDGTGKLQTPPMRLLHDVRVEFMMAGRQYKRFQNWLAYQGYVLCHRHSCGDEIVRLEAEESWYDNYETDQMVRTQLDWDGTHEMVDCFGCLKKKCFWDQRLSEVYREIFQITEAVLRAAGFETRMPTLADFPKAA